jgi:hypothetical protein
LFHGNELADLLRADDEVRHVVATADHTCGADFVADQSLSNHHIAPGLNPKTRSPQGLRPARNLHHCGCRVRFGFRPDRSPFQGELHVHLNNPNGVGVNSIACRVLHYLR